MWRGAYLLKHGKKGIMRILKGRNNLPDQNADEITDKLKEKSMTSSGLELAISQLVACSLNEIFISAVRFGK
jgi:hypothetical protein